MFSQLLRRPNRFLERRKTRRIAAIVTARFPMADQQFAYVHLQRLALRLDADFSVFYEDPVDPRTLDPETKPWLSQGFLSPRSLLKEDADIDHFRRTCPDRLATALMRVAGALGCLPEAVLQIDEARAGISQARMVQAWAADVLVSFYAFEGGLKAYLVCALLQIPRLLFLGELGGGEENWLVRLLPLHIRQAEWVVVPTEAMIEELVARFGEEVRSKVLCTYGNPNWEIDITRRTAAILRGRPAAVTRKDLGPEPAFRTQIQARLAHQGLTPFVIVGAERTGSNLLTDMLMTHPQIQAAGEIFNTRMIEDGVFDMRHSSAAEAEELIELRRLDPGNCINRLLQISQRSGAAIAGFKLLYFHGTADNRIIDHLLAMPELRVVHLVREDRLARWASLARAMSSDVWWAAAGVPQTAKGQPLALDPQQTLLALEEGELLEERYRATFARSRVLEISYEQLASELEITSTRVLQFLGAELRPLAAQSRKTGDKDVARSIANWDELVEAFTDTRWQDQFHRD